MYCVVSKNAEGVVYSISPPQEKRHCEAQKEVLEKYMTGDHKHIILTEEEAKQYEE